MRRSVDFWYFLIYLRATVPGLNLWGFLTPVVTGADFRAIFWAMSCFRGTFWAVDFLAVCFVLAIESIQFYYYSRSDHFLDLYCAFFRIPHLPQSA
jgi:hypothetical protein